MITNGFRENADEKVIDEAIARTYQVSPKMELELDNRFTYHSPRPDQLPRYQYIRETAKNLARLIAKFTPPSREQALALTKLEEAVMHANSAIAREPEPREQPLPERVTRKPVDEAAEGASGLVGGAPSAGVLPGDTAEVPVSAR